jgi:hypothetical protein
LIFLLIALVALVRTIVGADTSEIDVCCTLVQFTMTCIVSVKGAQRPNDFLSRELRRALWNTVLHKHSSNPESEMFDSKDESTLYEKDADRFIESLVQQQQSTHHRHELLMVGLCHSDRDPSVNGCSLLEAQDLAARHHHSSLDLSNRTPL